MRQSARLRETEFIQSLRRERERGGRERVRESEGERAKKYTDAHRAR